MASRRHAFIYQRSLERRTDYQPPAEDQGPQGMTPKEVREYLGCSASMVDKLRDQGDILVSHKVGRVNRYDRESVEGYKGSRAGEMVEQ